MSKPGKPIIAIMYDFDKTLSTRDMQEYGFIPNLGLSAEQFWSEVKELRESENMDPILAYLYHMLKKAADKGVPVTYEKFVSLGEGIEQIIVNPRKHWYVPLSGLIDVIKLLIEKTKCFSPSFKVTCTQILEKRV